jgi:predicted CopG family antitoxin
MTNITLSIKDEIYNRMKKHSEIKWSEIARKAIEKKIQELESIKENNLCMEISKEILEKEWNNPFDERWNQI